MAPDVEEVKDEDEDEEDKLQKEGDKKKPEEKKAPAQQEIVPDIYNCPLCTFANPISSSRCDICQNPRPPMEQIIADLRAIL